MWLSDGEKFEGMFILFDRFHEHDRWTLQDSIGPACIASHGKNQLRLTSPCTVNVEVDSSRSIEVTPDKRRACIMFAPCVPIDNPIKSLLTWNSSRNDEPRGAYDVREL